jgi:DNA-binding MarR family transcriptional regulator
MTRTSEAAGRPEQPDRAPILPFDPLDVRISLASIVHWADSHEVRVRLLRDVDFPVDDLPMFLVVNQLAHRGGMRPTDLAQVIGTGKANLSKIANRLVAAGLVARVRSADDERSVLLALTPAGREIGQRIMAQAQQTLDAVLADWPPEDVDALRRLLARLAAATGGMSESTV